MKTTAAFVERVQKRYDSFLKTARSSEADEEAAHEAAVGQTARAMAIDGYFGLTPRDVRRLVRSPS